MRIPKYELNFQVKMIWSSFLAVGAMYEEPHQCILKEENQKNYGERSPDGNPHLLPHAPASAPDSLKCHQEDCHSQPSIILTHQ